MKLTLIAILSLLSMFVYSNNRKDTCRGEYKAIIYKGDTVVVGCDRMVVMNPETYAYYYHNNESLKKLRKDIPEWASIIDSINKSNSQNILDLEQAMALREKQLELQKATTEELIEDMWHVETQNKKYKKENKLLKKLFGGSSLFSVILLIILI